MIYVGLYFAIGLPIAIAFALTKPDVPIYQRIVTVLIVLPVWPVWSIGLLALYLQKFKIEKLCAWCGRPMLLGKKAARLHVLHCEKHPYREVLRAHGFDIAEDGDGDWIITDYNEAQP